MKISPNQQKGRAGYKIEAIVIHITQGDYAGALSWLTNPQSQVSAHFLIGKDGHYEQLVACDNTAWHAGIVKNPSCKLLKPGVNPNLYTLGIENAGTIDTPPTAEQIFALADLVGDLCKRFSIPLDTDHIIPHHAIRSDKSCPGPFFDCSHIVWLAHLTSNRKNTII